MQNNSITKMILLLGTILLVIVVGYQATGLEQVTAIPKPTVVRSTPQPTAPMYGPDNPIPIPQIPTEIPISPYPAPVAPTGMPFHPPDTSVPFVEVPPTAPIPAPNPSVALPLPLSQTDGIERAIALAREHGLTKPRPDKFVVQQMTLGEWNKLTDTISGPDAAKFGLDPNQLVWVVTMVGKGVWSGPGGLGGEADKFDNITIVVSVTTGEHKGTLIAGPGQPLPLQVP